MESVVDRYKQMAIKDGETEINLDDNELEDVPAEDVAAGFPVIGQVLTDRKVRFSELKEQMLALWRPGKGLVLERKKIGSHLRAGSGVKTSPTGGKAWLLEGSSSSGKSGGADRGHPDLKER
ncbi:unnamed protein product [Cuscuta epithymum]|uniref:Uncharacterized protein n=1 Tax=Cuscuta epithymum TaxID=186058 RepID=A0AAV0C6C1_9ASTE|nr:unnamed protein product [Cuscuta epithymum]